MRKILSSILTLLTLVTLLIFSANSFAQQVPFANVPFDTANIPEPVPPPAAVRDFFQLDSYYQQWINVRGFPVLASAEVRPYTIKEVAWTIGQMVGHRPDILRAMAQNRARFSIVPHNKHLTDIPEYDFGRLDFFWEMRARGVGGRITSSPEENIICGDRNYCFAEVIHEFAHQVHDYGLGNWGIQGVDSTFDKRLNTLYNMAKEEGLYQNRYAGSNKQEYWAEGVGSWFNGPHPDNVAHTRSVLKEYDPRLAGLLTEVFGDGSWRYTPPATRTHLPHLQGFNPEEAPIYQRPTRLLELEAQLRDPNSDGDGKWVNLKLHDPSELPRLLNSAAKNNSNSTEFLFVNRTGTDISLYFFSTDGTKWLHQHSTTQDVLAVGTWVGAVWLLQDHTGKDIAVFRAGEQVGRVLIGGPPSQDVLDVNSDGIVDLLDLIPIASGYGRHGVNPADINKDRIVNIVDVLLVAGSVFALPQQVVETFKATEVQKWLTDAKLLGIENEYQQKGIVVLEHLLAEIAFLSTPREAAGRSEAVFRGHTDIVWSVAFSPDGQTLASSGWDDKIRLWNAETKQHEITLIEQSDIMTVAFSPDGQTLASGNWDAAVRLWDPSTGKIKKTLRGHTDGIESVVFSPDGETLASSSADGTIRLWNPRNGTLKRTLTGQARIRSMAFSPDGNTLASGSADTTIQLWNPHNGTLKRTLTGHTDWIEGVAFSPDGNMLASGGGGSERTLRLWNPHNGQQKKEFTGYTGSVSGIAFSPDGQLLASGSWGPKIRLWNTETGKDENALEGHTRGVLSIAFSPDGQLLVSGGQDGTVRLWDITPSLSQQPIDDSDKIAISEIMIASNGGRLPQWIEFHNRSDTHAVNLKGWKLEIQNYRSENFNGLQNITITLKEKSINPQETLLIVSKQGESSNNSQNEQVYNLSNLHPHLQDVVLSEEGFYLKLSNVAGELIDEGGNLDGKRNTNDKPAWSLPRILTKDEVRTSIIRQHDNGTPRLGTEISGWISAVNTNLATSTTTYYGHPDDIGAPGIKSGGALPVSLSRFRAELAETGVIIKWITESELDNAGFYILRSKTKDGDFKIVNPALIQGAGTTSERHTYTWKDTAAKPNVVYYYRIEDVSYTGVRQQLATVRMRGYVSAVDKLTTKWGDLKLQE